MPFAAEELEEMRRADEEIEREFRWTNEELQAARERDREARLDSMDGRKQKVADYQRAYYEANREKVAAARRAYYETNREKLADSQRWLREERKEWGYTQREVAERIGTTQPEIALLESGRMKLESFGKKEELCALLGR